MQGKLNKRVQACLKLKIGGGKSVKEKIKEFALGMGVDDVGIVALKDYTSSRSPDLQTIFPGAKSLIVLAYKELSNCESENMQIATGGGGWIYWNLHVLPITGWRVSWKGNLRQRR